MVNLMELQMNSLNQNVNVMTDEQVETLRKQIAVYAVISEQLLQMHKNQNCTDMNSRHRWAPTPVQLQTMEQIFEAETECPSKEKIKEIVADLTKHGQISETNVYNWFQNRRARYKRKHQSSVNVESEVEAEVDSDDKKIDEFCASQLAFDGSSNYLTGKMEAPESNHAYEPAGEHNTEDMAVSVSEIIGLGSTYSSCNLSRFWRRVNATSPNTTLVSSIIFPTRRKWSSVVVRAQNSSTYSSQKEDLVYVAKLVVGSFCGAGVIKYGSAIFPEITTPNLVLALVIISTPVLVAVLLLINQSLRQKS